MKKGLILGATTIALLSLSACSSKSQSTSSSSSSQSSSSSSSSSVKKIDNSKFEALVTELKAQLDPKNEGGFNFEIQNDIKDENVNGGTLIFVSGKTETENKNLKKAFDTANLGDEGAKLAKYALQKVVSDVAKKLPDNNSGIKLGAKDGSNSYLLAYSLKSKDVIPLN